MNAKQAAEITARELPNAISRAAALKTEKARLMQEHEIAEKKKADKAFDDRYESIQNSIKLDCNEGLSECRVNCQPDDCRDRIIERLEADGFSVRIGDNGYTDCGSDNDGYPNRSDTFWRSIDAYFISWAHQ